METFLSLNETTRNLDNSSCYIVGQCEAGVLLPIWLPINPGRTESIIRAIVYLVALLYSFLGVSIIADKFMAAIERITSQEKKVNVKLKTGETVVIRVRIWNETVSNLTLMALGSSAPEILLSIIEICGKNFEAGTIGPGTIVGSAAFNLFIIIGICIMVVPKGQCRKIKHLPVFIVTATFSVVAYVWLYLIIGVVSVGVIEIWEAIITLLLFPLTVVLAYLADKKLFMNQFGNRRYLVNKKRAINKGDTKNMLLEKHDVEAIEFENLREKYIFTISELRKEHPQASLQVLENMSIAEIFGKSKKSRAFYKMMATRKITGGGDLLNQSLTKFRSNLFNETDDSKPIYEMMQTIQFDPCHYTVMENVGSVSVTVKRAGGFLGSIVYVDYTTECDTAVKGKDYIFTKGTLEFLPFETEKNIKIKVINDDVFEEDEHFAVKLSNLKVVNGKEHCNYEYKISKTDKATVMILDDDHSGTFSFQRTVMEVNESCGIVRVEVLRSSGARGIVKVPFQVVDGTAKSGSDFIPQEEVLIFRNEETLKTIDIKVIDDSKYEKNEFFLVQLGEPELLDTRLNPLKSKSSEEKVDKIGLPKLGEWKEIKISIRENVVFKGMVDKIMKRANLSLTYGSSTWKEQFHDAIAVNSGEVDENGQEVMPSLTTFILHYLTLFWKLLFALVPPTEYFGGWLCFMVSVTFIGLLTALIGDLASSFGCSVGLLDEVTAITFVAIGTSLPDTFASKVSAIQDDSADSSIGNVTGSNAVNVFLGLGIAWTIATIVHAIRGTVFLVPLGSLGFSVTVFCILAVLAIMIIMARRTRFIGGELGGPSMYKYGSGLILFGFFLLYVILSSLKAYCHI